MSQMCGVWPTYPVSLTPCPLPLPCRHAAHGELTAPPRGGRPLTGWPPAAAVARPAATAAALPEGLGRSERGIAQMIEENKVLKSHIAKLAVIELREECAAAGLPADGLKADLVDRLLVWATAQAAARAAEAAKAAAAAAAGRRAAAAVPPAPLAAADPPDVRVQWLGTSSGAPTSRRNVSSIAVRYGEGRVFLVDAGEGTRNQLRTAGLDPASVTHIFVTHLHGDHCFGLPGALTTIAAARAGTPAAAEPIHVYGPPELHRLLLAAFKAARSAGLALTTPVIVTAWAFDPSRAAAPAAVDPDGMLRLGAQAPDQAGRLPTDAARALQAAYDGGSDQVVRPGLTWTTEIPGVGLTVTAAQLQHRMPCWGYVFEEATVPVEAPARRRAADANSNSNPATAASSTADPGWVRPGRKMVILGDTCDSTAILEVARGCDVLSHEATFQKGMEEKAAVATHSTSEQAGAFARAASARALVLTHFSGRYEQSDKYNRVWLEAKQKGKTMRDMAVSNVMPLAEEARAAAGGARVFLANDFYTFKVPVREAVPEGEWEEARRVQAHRMAAALEVGEGEALDRRGAGPAGALAGQRPPRPQGPPPGGRPQRQQYAGQGQGPRRGAWP